MVAFLPIAYYVAAGLLTAVTLSGCATQGPLPKPKAPPPPPPPPPKKPEAPKGPEFPKAALQLGEGERAVDGYSVLRKSIFENINLYRGTPFAPRDFAIFESRENPNVAALFNSMLQDPSRAAVAKRFVERVAALDGKPEKISPYDYLASSFFLYFNQWGEDWRQDFFSNDTLFPFSMAEQVKVLGAPLLDPSKDQAVAAQSHQMLQALSIYLQGSNPDDPNAKLLPLMDFFLDGKEPPVVSDYLKIPYGEFLDASHEKKVEIFQNAVAAQWPTGELIEDLSTYLQLKDMLLLTSECFKKDARASLPLFEGITLPDYFSPGVEGSSGEAKIFPNLPQDTPFPERQKAIDDFLGEPSLVRGKRDPLTGIKTIVKKYQWVAETEVFSIESSKPGPTTLVFSPHFHEENPRKYFHWLKDIPLQSGRVIFIPEANRAMWKLGQNTNPMNGLFNEALRSQRIDYVIVRRVEYLMGLVDGVIGDHDAASGPFYISDILVNEHGKGPAALGPKPSPWIPREVRDIKKINYDKEKTKATPPKKSQPSLKTPPLVTPEAPSTIREDNQIQWQIADYSRKKLRKLTGMDFHFEPENIRDERSHSADSTTGYAQFYLGKPAMTFEGKKGKEHGQLHAMAIYTLLLGFGHKISPLFERKLKDPLPKMEPDLYRGNHVTLTNLPKENLPLENKNY
jgi:hypothetical protein